MNDVEFERLLSVKLKFDHSPNEEHPCLRDLIFNYFEQKKGAEAADWHTKKYTDVLYARFVTRKA